MGVKPNTQTMDRVTAPAAVKALKAGRVVLALAMVGGGPEWAPVESIARHKAAAGHTYYVVAFASGYTRVFRAGGTFWMERASDA